MSALRFPQEVRAVALTVVIIGALLAGCSAVVNPATIADAQTAARVKTALVNDAELGPLTIEVEVRQGVAVLSGQVRSQAQVTRALDLARAVSGVMGVRSNLQISRELSPAPADPPQRQGSSLPDVFEIDNAPGLFAIGAAIGWSLPRQEALGTRVSISPVIKFGSPIGLAPAVGFDWFAADLQSAGGVTTLTRVHVKPVMGGLGYTVARNRLALTPSIVAGYAFNSLTVKESGPAQGLPVEVGNSFVWRLGASAWFDLNRRIAVNGSIGYLMTELPVTVLEGGRLERRDVRGDTTIVHVGAAYRLF